MTPNPDRGAGAAAAFRDADLPLRSPAFPPSCGDAAGWHPAREGREQEPAGEGRKGPLKAAGDPAAEFPNRLGHPVPLGSYGPMSSPRRLIPELTASRRAEPGSHEEHQSREQDGLRGRPSSPSPAGDWLDPTLRELFIARPRIQSVLPPRPLPLITDAGQ